MRFFFLSIFAARLLRSFERRWFVFFFSSRVCVVLLCFVCIFIYLNRDIFPHQINIYSLGSFWVYYIYNIVYCLFFLYSLGVQQCILCSLFPPSLFDFIFSSFCLCYLVVSSASWISPTLCLGFWMDIRLAQLCFFSDRQNAHMHMHIIVCSSMNEWFGFVFVLFVNGSIENDEDDDKRYDWLGIVAANMRTLYWTLCRQILIILIDRLTIWPSDHFLMIVVVVVVHIIGHRKSIRHSFSIGPIKPTIRIVIADRQQMSAISDIYMPKRRNAIKHLTLR